MRPLGSHPRSPQAGFSMVEMLMAAFILAVGILGLSLLQVMAVKAAGGGRNLTNAVQVAERFMDQIEMEGRLSWLNFTDSALSSPAALTTLLYVDKNALAAPLRYTINGRLPDPAAPLAADRTPFYTVTMTRVPGPALATGNLSDFTVTVAFSEAVNPRTQAPITRTVSLRRRIVHG